MESEATPPSRFRTPQQSSLYQRLLLLFGPGPAAYYSDACRLMVTDPPFDATTHLVMHLLREIESMIQAVLFHLTQHMLQTSEEARSRSTVLNGQQLKKLLDEASDKEASHEQKIRLIAEYLDVPETDALIQEWLRRAGKKKPDALHKHAHREGLGAPRPVDPLFRGYLDSTEQLFDGILRAFEPKYSAAVEIVDRLTANLEPTQAEANELRQRVPNTPVLLAHFFDHIDTPKWLPHLRAEGFFTHPPAAQRDVDTGEVVGYLPWPASRYLARMASRDGDHGLLLSIITGLMGTVNPWVRQDIVEALTALPATEIADLIPLVASWLEDE